MSLLEVDRLSICFGKHRKTAVDSISFSLEKASRLAIIGESGCGKTVTALSLMGLLPENAHVSGSITFDGQELLGESEHTLAKLRSRRISMIFQEPMTALDPTMKVGRQAGELFWLHTRQTKRWLPIGSSKEVKAGYEKVCEMFARVGIADPQRVADSYPFQLSGGQRQRVLVAMALLNRPDLVICDEPTTALDVTVQAKVLKVLDQELAAAKASAIFISHDLAVVSQICDYVLVMRNGKIVEQGSIAKIFNQPAHPYTKGLVATARIDLVKPGSRLPVVEDFLTAPDSASQG